MKRMSTKKICTNRIDPDSIVPIIGLRIVDFVHCTHPPFIHVSTCSTSYVVRSVVVEEEEEEDNFALRKLEILVLPFFCSLALRVLNFSILSKTLTRGWNLSLELMKKRTGAWIPPIVSTILGFFLSVKWLSHPVRGQSRPVPYLIAQEPSDWTSMMTKNVRILSLDVQQSSLSAAPPNNHLQPLDNPTINQSQPLVNHSGSALAATAWTWPFWVHNTVVVHSCPLHHPPHTTSKQLSSWLPTQQRAWRTTHWWVRRRRIKWLKISCCGGSCCCRSLTCSAGGQTWPCYSPGGRKLLYYIQKS